MDKRIRLSGRPAPDQVRGSSSWHGWIEPITTAADAIQPGSFVFTFAISWFMIGKIAMAGSIAGLEIVTKAAWYDLHERIWAAVSWVASLTVTSADRVLDLRHLPIVGGLVLIRLV
jgi:uncharacterized membrane protein